MARGAPPADALLPPPQRATTARRSAPCGAGAGSSGPHQLHPGNTGRGTLAAPRDERPGKGQRLTADAPHSGGRPAPPGRPPTTPAERSPPQVMQAKGTVLGPHARTCAPTVSGLRNSTARPEDGQPGEGKRLHSDAPHNGARHPPRGRPPASPTACNAGSQERTLWGRCWVPHAHTTRARDTQATGPGRLQPVAGSQARDSA